MMSILIALGILNLAFMAVTNAGRAYGTYLEVARAVQAARLVRRTMRVRAAIESILGHQRYTIEDTGKGSIVLQVPMGTGVVIGTSIVHALEPLLPRGTTVEIKYIASGVKDVN
jgi:hypothetical protein